LRKLNPSTLLIYGLYICGAPAPDVRATWRRDFQKRSHKPKIGLPLHALAIGAQNPKKMVSRDKKHFFGSELIAFPTIFQYLASSPWS